MRIEIVQDNVDFPAGVSGQNIVHEIQNLAPAARRVMANLHLTGGHFQRRKQRARAVPFVTVAESVQRLAVRQPEPSLSSFQNLNVRLLVHALDDRVLRRT